MKQICRKEIGKQRRRSGLGTRTSFCINGAKGEPIVSLAAEESRLAKNACLPVILLFRPS